ncbi:glycosyltransferase family 2 protein [Agromyces sp. NPDC056523]|uniref:glycosyltransferase family 2 protein n=1 Tax=Agromyces sp. NPDC056523 TaxID=3345850 RepID=UPI00367307E1
MTAAPIVSIVVPLFNGGPFIDETLRSVLAQTFSRFEVIVVDDGSTDDGPGIVRALLSDGRVHLVESPHVGVADARNTGAARAHAASSYLAFLDADDVWSPDVLATLVRALEERPDAAGAFALAEYIDDSGRMLHPGDFPRHMRGREDLRDGRLVPRDSVADVHSEHLFLSNLIYPPSCLLIRRSAFDAAGGFDGGFLAEDWEFVARLAKPGPLVPVDRAMVGYRRHASNASSDRGRNVTGARQVWAAVYHRARESEERRRLRGIWRAHQRRTARRKLAEGGRLLSNGRLVTGIRSIADGLAHAAVRHPPRIWLSQASRRRRREVGAAGLSRSLT